MAVEDHPKYAQWRQAQDELTAAIEAKKEGKATKDDVERAQQAYDKISEEIGGAA